MTQTEILIEQFAEIRAQNSTALFMLMSFLENQGANPDMLLTAIDVMLCDAANRFEAEMRKAEGLEPRAEPRKPMIKPEEVDLMRSIRWDNLKEQ